MAQALDFLRIVRPINGLMTAWAILIGASVATPIMGAADFDWWTALAAMLSGALLVGFGNVANDIADRETDKTAHPNRPIPSGRMSLGLAATYAFVLGNLGILLALLAGGLPLLVFAFANALALLLYAAVLKDLPIIGNLVVAGLVSSAFFFGAVATETAPNPASNWGALVGFAVMAGLATMARENAKGLQDRDADVGRWTLARLSPTGAAVVVVVNVAAACFLAAWVASSYDRPWWLREPITWEGMGRVGQWFGLSDYDLKFWQWGVAAAIPPLAAGGIWVWRDPRMAQKLLKAGMLVAMLGFSYGALLAWQSW